MRLISDPDDSGLAFTIVPFYPYKVINGEQMIEQLDADVMSKESLKLLINDCFEQIAERDESIASYWVEQLFDLQTGEIKSHMITEATLQSLEKDVVAVYNYEQDEF